MEDLQSEMSNGNNVHDTGEKGEVFKMVLWNAQGHSNCTIFNYFPG